MFVLPVCFQYQSLDMFLSLMPEMFSDCLECLVTKHSSQLPIINLQNFPVNQMEGGSVENLSQQLDCIWMDMHLNRLYIHVENERVGVCSYTISFITCIAMWMQQEHWCLEVTLQQALSPNFEYDVQFFVIMPKSTFVLMQALFMFQTIQFYKNTELVFWCQFLCTKRVQERNEKGDNPSLLYTLL